MCFRGTVFEQVKSAAENAGFLGAFAKLRKATINFVTSVRMQELGSHCTDFDET